MADQMTLLARVDWDAVDARSRTEQAKRERHAPWVSVYRWWARRPSAVVGALLDAGRDHFGDTYVVSDVFSGGGTVAFEAASRSLPVYAQDLYPWPTTGLAAGLRATDPGAFRLACNELLEGLAPLRKHYSCPGGSELSHVLRVRTVECSSCRHDYYLFRRPLVSSRSRSPGEKHGYHWCRACGGVSLRKLPTTRFKCDHCGHWPRGEPTPQRGRPQNRCPHCEAVTPLADILSGPPKWTPVLVQEVCYGPGKPLVTIRPHTVTDPVNDVTAGVPIPALSVPIPEGLEPDCLARDGHRDWSSLYTNRQILFLTEAVKAIAAMSCPPGVKERLRVAVIGACEMAANVSRWEPHYPKAFEAIANHRYARTTISTETNLLSPVGRGTLPRRLEAAGKAVNWWSGCASPTSVKVVDGKCRRRRHTKGVLIAVGSSTRQVISDVQVDLIVTDPPYHDDVQYGELARLFHVWLSIAGLPSPSREHDEVVPNKYRGHGTEWYRDTFTACLAEGRRTLAPRGRLILTYHNNRIDAWHALGSALFRAGFRIIAIATTATENAADHCKRGRRVFLHDLVLECVVSDGRRRDRAPAVIGRSDSDERVNLLAVGLALSENREEGRPRKILRGLPATSRTVWHSERHDLVTSANPTGGW